ncbi:hypothetical protein P5V43_12765 [Mycobacteroides abscessus subsp. bolletii]|uniref:hypothetical protein n=1 Tax=Mycobacteroides abscessus TaxID=36809 RepID=UPI00266D4144|nr:hypothetical protein [Mycobacteroides abscessus]MDO3127976.1 hypothetical protein [Mycobacteroides abscessus subsp. bolletii]
MESESSADYEPYEPARFVSEFHRKATGDLPPSANLGTISNETTTVADRIQAIADRVSARDSYRAASLREVAVKVRSIRDLLNEELSVDLPDRSFAFLFGKLVAPRELSSLRSQSEITQSYIGTSTDSKVIAHIRDFGDFLSDWRVNALNPAAEYLRSAIVAIEKVRGSTNLPPKVMDLITESAVRRLNQNVALSDRATTAAGQQGLAKAFVEASEKSKNGAIAWTIGVFACVAAGIGLPIWALSIDGPILAHMTGSPGIVARILIGLPTLALAAYCGHIAAQHRETARHMDILTAQLNSVGAYSNELPDEKRLELLMLLGKRTFSDPGFVLRDKGNLTYVPDDTLELLKKLSELLSRKPG